MDTYILEYEGQEYQLRTQVVTSEATKWWLLTANGEPIHHDVWEGCEMECASEFDVRDYTHLLPKTERPDRWDYAASQWGI